VAKLEELAAEGGDGGLGGDGHCVGGYVNKEEYGGRRREDVE
jgi:hypothetical protein